MSDVTILSDDNSPPEIADASGAHCIPPYDLFICYRRESTGYHAAVLFEKLFESFGEVVFIDHECLEGGEHWRQRIDNVMAHVDTAVVLLTSNWLEEFRARAEAQQDDEVLRELAMALRHRKHLFPILLDGTKAPTQSDASALAAHPELCTVVRALADVQALPWRSSSHQSDLATIIDKLPKRLLYGRKALNGAANASRPSIAPSGS